MHVKIGPYPKSAKKERKIDIRVDNFDTWNLDHTLSLIIYQSLVYFRNSELHSYPSEFYGGDEYVPAGAVGGGMDGWLAVLDEIIAGFKLYVEDTGIDSTLDDYEKKWEKIQHAVELFAKYFFDLWD